MKIHLAFLSLLLLAACSSQPHIEGGYYHWKGVMALDSTEQAALCRHPLLYLRFFDVHARPGQEAQPIGSLQGYTPPPCPTDIVPVVFITQPAIKGLSAAQTDSLADRVARKIRGMATRWGITFRQVQIDSDWTPSTRQTYFRLLRRIKQQLGCQLSITLRLHQTKDVETNGIPPADRALLMAYNLQDVRSPQLQNTILNMSALNIYLPYIAHYPLPMDVALPIFGWAAQYREGKLIDLIQDAPMPAANDSSFIYIQENQWVVKKNTYFSGKYWYAGDMLKLEYPARHTLYEAAQAIRKHMPPSTDSMRLLLYHLHTPNLHRYAPADTLFDIFTHPDA